MLELRPHQLDRIVLGRVARQRQYSCARGFDKADSLRTVDAGIVPEDDIARFQARHEMIADELLEDGGRHATLEMYDFTPIGGHPADETAALADPKGRVLNAARPARGISVGQAHAAHDAGLIDEDQARRVEQLHRRGEEGPLQGHLGTLLLRGSHHLFFRVKFQRPTWRCTVWRLTVRPVSASKRAAISAWGMETFSARKASKRGRSASVS